MKNKTFGDVKKFTVERSSWLRGNGSLKSKLMNRSGNKCCLGFYALECGLKEESINGASNPSEVAIEGNKWKTFLLSSRRVISSVGMRLMQINDEEDYTDDVREEKLKEVFENCGVAVRFVD